ncbi:MAG: hypothetical protein A3J29_15890 [Acidobacteria bacterium RIFCSPLOWO2_12_FULL_67_14b]|nr:MAG: hypothetical protein A3J29_15890 [Acidobacteria bacterium RIFCSPLOWO2_12_FULL_67_14b]
MSQASARELPGTVDFRENRGKAGELSHQRAQAPTAATVPNRPACAATPSSASAFSSWTTPHFTLPNRSTSVGAVRSCHAASGRNRTSMSAPISLRRHSSNRRSSGAPVAFSRANPSSMNPGSLYSDLVRGAYSSGSAQMAASNDGRPLAVL